jgi:hypothetical protein
MRVLVVVALLLAGCETDTWTYGERERAVGFALCDTMARCNPQIQFTSADMESCVDSYAALACRAKGEDCSAESQGLGHEYTACIQALYGLDCPGETLQGNPVCDGVLK